MTVKRAIDIELRKIAIIFAFCPFGNTAFRPEDAQVQGRYVRFEI
jgi:hypothetical protein